MTCNTTNGFDQSYECDRTTSFKGRLMSSLDNLAPTGAVNEENGGCAPLQHEGGLSLDKRRKPQAGAPGARGIPRSRFAVEAAVSQVFGVMVDDLRRTSRGRARVALARQVAMYLSHVGFGLSLTEVGRLFDRDRTTVAHACTVVEDRRDDATFDRTLELLEWASRAIACERSGETRSA